MKDSNAIQYRKKGYNKILLINLIKAFDILLEQNSKMA